MCKLYVEKNIFEVLPSEDLEANSDSSVAEAGTPDHRPGVEHGLPVFERATFVVGDGNRNKKRQRQENTKHGRS